MKKIQIIILIVAGILSFASAFTVSWMINKKKAAAVAQQLQQQQQEQQTQVNADADDPFGFSEPSKTNTINFASLGEDRIQMGMTERQLQHLIFDIRDKMKEYQSRQKALDTEAERIEISRAALQEDIERLNSLRDKLNVTLANIQQKEESLKKSLIEIQEIEKSNYQRLAATYDKMDSTQAGRIMISMAAGSQMEDSVKILYYMSERTVAKLLAEIATTKPELASVISLQLKHIKEVQ